MRIQVFISDKKRQAAFGGSEPFNRIKKSLIKEVESLIKIASMEDLILQISHGIIEIQMLADRRKTHCFFTAMNLRGNEFDMYLHAQVTAMTAADQVLVIGLTEEPQACVKADQSTLESFFDLKLYLPLPDYASRRVQLSPFAGFSSALHAEHYHGKNL